MYISNISSIHMYISTVPLDPTCDRDRSVPSYCVRLVKEAKRQISKSHKHHAKGMVSVPQKTLRSHINTEWTWIQTWQADTNIIHIAHLFSFIRTTWIFHNPSIYLVFETEARNQPLRILRMRTYALFLQTHKEDDTRNIRCTYNINNNFLHLIPCRY